MITDIGREQKVRYMYQKGKEFVAAAVLLKQHGGSTHVRSHLICQGVELIFKALLLYKDYEKYNKAIKEKIKHDLIVLIDTWKVELNGKKIDSKFRAEIANLNELYKSTGLRYGSIVDSFFEPKTIKTNEIMKYLCKIIAKWDKILFENAVQQRL